MFKLLRQKTSNVPLINKLNEKIKIQTLIAELEKKKTPIRRNQDWKERKSFLLGQEKIIYIQFYCLPIYSYFRVLPSQNLNYLT